MDLNTEISDWITSARVFAHEEAHFIDTTRGQDAGELYREQLRLKVRLPKWESAITFVYSVDRHADTERPGQFRLFRHLSCQYSVPAHVPAGAAAPFKEGLLAAFLPFIEAMWPVRDDVGTHFQLHEPIPVQGPSGEAGYRTPMVWHFLTPHDGLPMPGAGASGRLVDQHGRQLQQRATRNLATSLPASSEISLAAIPVSQGGLAPDAGTLHDAETGLSTVLFCTLHPWCKALFERQQVNTLPEELTEQMVAAAMLVLTEHWTGAH